MKNFLVIALLGLTGCAGLLNTNTLAAQEVEGDWGSLTGQIIVEGDIPAGVPENVGDHKDKPVCLVDGELPMDDNVMINEENKGLKNVVIMMYQKKPTPVPTHPSYDELKAEPVVLDNVNCRFVPKVVFVRPGQELILRNSDPVGHNCHINAFNNEHNPLLPANDEITMVLENEEKSPAKVTCDLHTWMDSVIMIRDNPYVAVSDEEGKFTIENLPPGDWKFQFWHQEPGYMRKLQVPGGAKVGRKGEIDVTITKGETKDLGEMQIEIDDLVSKKK